MLLLEYHNNRIGKTIESTIIRYPFIRYLIPTVKQESNTYLDSAAFIGEKKDLREKMRGFSNGK